jgi:hypothetical protein
VGREARGAGFGAFARSSSAAAYAARMKEGDPEIAVQSLFPMNGAGLNAVAVQTSRSSRSDARAM